MQTGERVFFGADIQTSDEIEQGNALHVDTQGRAQIIAPDAAPKDCAHVQLEGGLIAPGFIDLQVNGGGGVMFNDDPSIATLRQMAKAHRALGTAAFLPTLITDTAATTTAAIAAVAHAIDEGVPGVIGLHLEGPHLSVARKGAHSADLIRAMEPRDLEELLAAAKRLPNLMVTVAPESVNPEQIATLSDAGVIVSLGHTDAGYDACMAAFDAGARMVTHLFNAMSGFHHRDPGLVGAALDREGISIGVIADGIHVHPKALALALRAKSHFSGICLVTDAMATAGSDISEFSLNSRIIQRQDGRLTLSDGTLAGADLELLKACRFIETLGFDRDEAMDMAIGGPRSVLRNPLGFGFLEGPAERLNYIKGDTIRPLV